MSTNTINSKMLEWIVLTSKAEDVKQTAHGRSWTEDEDQFLKENLSWLTDEEMGSQLGRSALAVHLRWTRDLHLPSPSKSPDVVTANQAAEMLGIDGHKTAYWVDVGLIPGRLMPGKRKIRLIKRVSFMVWACSPKNWVYFKIDKVKDLHLKQLLKLKQKRWGDEWWSIPQVCKYHGVDHRHVNQHIHNGKLKAFRSTVSYGGRHPVRAWSYNYVLKSEAINHTFLHRGDDMTSITPRGLKWMKKALRMGWTMAAIARSMKVNDQTISNWKNKYIGRK